MPPAQSAAATINHRRQGTSSSAKNTNRSVTPSTARPRLPVAAKSAQSLGTSSARPNPSLEPTRTGMALGPPAGLVHHPSSGPSAIPARSAQPKRSAAQSRSPQTLLPFALPNRPLHNMKPLVVPPAAQQDEDSVQMLSTWIAQKGLHSTLNIGFFSANGRDEAGSWGILIADLVRHIGNAWQEEQGVPAEATVASIRQALEAELDYPTSRVTGSFHPGHS